MMVLRHSDAEESSNKRFKHEVNSGSDIESTPYGSGSPDPDWTPMLESGSSSSVIYQQCSSEFTTFDDRQETCSALPPLSAIQHVHEVETGHAENLATVGTCCEGLVKPETFSEDSYSDCSHSDVESSAEANSGSDIESTQCESGPLDPEWTPPLNGSCSQDSLGAKKSAYHTRKRSLCGVCNKHFSDLTGHLRTHIGEMPYSCDRCDKAFTQYVHLAIHLLTHTGEKPYLCDICGERFTEYGHLTVHFRTHSGEMPYSCDTCGEIFTQVGLLARHLRTHTGERPYLCGTCGKAFSRSDNLAVHLRIHTGEKPYLCDKCGETFTYSSSFAIHLSSHI